MPFFRENEINLAELETGIVGINGSKIPMTKGDMDTDVEESPGDMETPTIGMISRKRIKKELRRGQIEELYLAMIQVLEDEAKEAPDWIQKEYGTVLREELPPEMPPT